MTSMKYLICLIKLLAVLSLSLSQEDYKRNSQAQNSLAELEKAAKEAESLDKLFNTGNEATALTQKLMKTEIEDDDAANEQDLDRLLNKELAENQQDEEPQQEEKAMAAQDLATVQYSKRYLYRRMRMYKRYYHHYLRHYRRQRNLHMKYRRLFSVYHRSNTWCLQQLSRG